jgi:hypothetical protein
LAARFLPATFFTRLRAASVLPRALLAFLRGMVRLAFRFRFATLRAERAPRAAAMMNPPLGCNEFHLVILNDMHKSRWSLFERACAHQAACTHTHMRVLLRLHRVG